MSKITENPCSPSGSRIKENLRLVNLRIEKAARDHNRNKEAISLLAVSKKHGAESIIEAFDSGQQHFGENYVQEAIDKMQQLSSLDITWHFIGPIQSNKTRAIAENFSWVHSVDRLKIAERLAKQRPAHLPPLNLCIQINIDEEASKSGIDLAELETFVDQLQQWPQLKLRGLMTIPQAGASEAAFRRMQDVFTRIQQSGRCPDFDTLSMGMSADLETAIACGSTMVRVGTDIFGARQT
ncbi:Alanine racemase [Thalassocella blandensis]|nr:Alanine racemase [Thalassocella blandensis]